MKLFSQSRKGPNLRADTRAATAIEFAILAPVFLAGVFGVHEYSRALWVKQVLSDTSQATVRCVSSANTACETDALLRDFAVAEADRRGVTIQPSAVTLETSVVCRGFDASRVQLVHPFSSPVAGLPGLNKVITAEACFPNAPTP